MTDVANPGCRISILLAAIAVSLAPAAAQTVENSDSGESTENVAEPDDGTLVIDIKAVQNESDSDPILAERCEEIADAARIANEIVVCRDLGETTDGSWNQEDFIRRYAEATQGPKTPDVDGSGLPFGMTPIVEIRGCFIPPCPGEPALLIDVTALPKAPPGSDADRIARGLPPLGEEGDSGRITTEDELGLPPAPQFSADED